MLRLLSKILGKVDLGQLGTLLEMETIPALRALCSYDVSVNLCSWLFWL